MGETRGLYVLDQILYNFDVNLHKLFFYADFFLIWFFNKSLKSLPVSSMKVDHDADWVGTNEKDLTV